MPFPPLYQRLDASPSRLVHVEEEGTGREEARPGREERKEGPIR